MMEKFNNIVSKLFRLRDFLEHAHRSTLNVNHHGPLGDAYDRVTELNDRVIEILIAKYEQPYEYISQLEFDTYTSLDIPKILNDFKSVVNDLKSLSEELDVPSLSNLADEYDETSMILKYKTTILKSFSKNENKI